MTIQKSVYNQFYLIFFFPIVQSSTIEQQHSIIEYSEAESCYILQDLNTATGTYVNDCRVQNAVVRLAPGDIIRFGYAGAPHELEIEDAPMVCFVFIYRLSISHDS